MVIMYSCHTCTHTHSQPDSTFLVPLFFPFYRSVLDMKFFSSQPSLLRRLFRFCSFAHPFSLLCSKSLSCQPLIQFPLHPHIIRILSFLFFASNNRFSAVSYRTPDNVFWQRLLEEKLSKTISKIYIITLIGYGRRRRKKRITEKCYKQLQKQFFHV